MIGHLQIIRGTDTPAGMAGMLDNQLKGLRVRSWHEDRKSMPSIADAPDDGSASGNRFYI